MTNGISRWHKGQRVMLKHGTGLRAGPELVVVDEVMDGLVYVKLVGEPDSSKYLEVKSALFPVEEK